MSSEVAERILKHQSKRRRGRARRIVIDLDATEDPTHGAQQLSFFNGFYDSWCYLPYIVSAQFDDESEGIVLATILRPGNSPGSAGARSVLKRALQLVRRFFRKASLYVRLDGGFATPELLEFLDDADVGYVVGFPKNAVLARLSGILMHEALQEAKRLSASSVRYGKVDDYESRNWDEPRRVIYKAEALFRNQDDIAANHRYVVTNIRWQPRRVYEFYVQRCESENRIKELHLGLEIDRTSCSKFSANQLRALFTLAAFALYQEIRHLAADTSCNRAQVWTLRERLFKIGARFVVSARRIVLHLPSSAVWKNDWIAVARALGALPI